MVRILATLILLTLVSSTGHGNGASTLPQTAEVVGREVSVTIRNLLVVLQVAPEARALVYRSSSCGSRKYRVGIVKIGKQSIGEITYGCNDECILTRYGSESSGPTTDRIDPKNCHEYFHEGRALDEDGL